MARIKYVLNERRLGLIAAANPLITQKAPMVPFSSSKLNDPMSAIEALRGLSISKSSAAPAPKEVLRADEEAAVVTSGEVAKQEVEGRDEGFGGGKEAETFVDDVVVRDGHVEKR
jgi:large subunit ribosomal protein L47